ncbi:TPA: hypothetical protein ACJJ53_000879, partial [Neisseria meningitidis]
KEIGIPCFPFFVKRKKFYLRVNCLTSQKKFKIYPNNSTIYTESSAYGNPRKNPPDARIE